jgi:PilZ domain
MSDSPDSEDRRAYRRYELWFPVTLKIAEREVWGICRDASPGGLKVSTNVVVAPGSAVTAVFRVAPGEIEHRVEGVVTRSWQNEHELMLAFPGRIAIEFAQPVPELEQDLLRRSGAPASGEEGGH